MTDRGIIEGLRAAAVGSDTADTPEGFYWLERLGDALSEDVDETGDGSMRDDNFGG